MIALRSSAGLLAASALFGFNPEALAATSSWTGGSATDGNWSDTSNWVNGAAPGAITGTTSTDIAFFTAAGGMWGTLAQPIVIDQPTQNIGGITFTGGAGNYFIGSTSGNALLLTNGGTIQISGPLTGINVIETINAPLVIEGTAYTLANNTIPGTGVGAGTLDIGASISGSSSAATTLTISGSNANLNTISGVISSGSAVSLGVTKSGSGVWILSGANTYSGATTISSGTLQAGVASVPGVSGAFGNNSAVTLANAAGVTMNLAGFNTQVGSLAGGGATVTSVVLGSGTLTTGGNNTNTTYTGLISGAGGSIIKTGSGTFILSGTSTYTGPTTINLGTLAFTTESALYNNTPASWTAANITVSGSSGLRLSVGSASPQFTSADITTLLTNMDAGSSAASGFESGSILGLDTGLATGGTFTLSTSIANGFSGGTMGLTKSGAGTLTLTGANTYTGPTLISGGTLEFSAETSLYNDATASWNGNNITVLNGATLALAVGASPQFTDADLGTLLSGMDSVSSGTNGFENGSTLGIDTTSAGGTFTANSTIANPYVSGTIGLNKLGTGTLILGGNNGYSGPTTITSGTLQAGVASNPGVSGAFGLNSAVNITNVAGNTLSISGFNTQIGSLAGGGTNATFIVLGGNTLTTGALNASNTYTGFISGVGGGITKTGTGTLTLNGTSTYTGATTISSGGIEFGNKSALYNGVASNWNGNDIIVGSGGVLDLALGSSPQFSISDLTTLLANVDSTSSATTGFESGSVLGLDTGTNSLTYSSSIANGFSGGTMGLTKLGTGRLTLSGTDTYTGVTTIAGGILKFTGESALYNDNTSLWNGSNIIVQNGATLSLDVGNASPQFTASDLGTLLSAMDSTSSATSGFESGSILSIDTHKVGTTGTFTFSGVIGNGFAGATMGLTKIGAGTLDLNGSTVESYTGPTVLNGGNLTLDLTNLPSPINLISSTSALTMNGGTLQLIGQNGVASSQTFAGTSFVTGGAIISAAPATGSVIPTLNLGTLTGATGATVEFIGPAYNGGASSGTTLGGTLVAANSTITATANTITGGLISNSTASSAGASSYATVNAYDWAAISTGTLGSASTGNIVGGSQISGFYTEMSGGTIGASGINLDITATVTTNSSSQFADQTWRFNSNTAAGITLGNGGGKLQSIGGILVTPNVGVNNVPINGTGANSALRPTTSTTGGNEFVIWQNNILGELTFNATALLNNGSGAGATANYVQAGPGTVVFGGGANGYSGLTYLNGGIMEIPTDSTLGSTANSSVNLNGGTLLGNYTGNLDNGSGTAHPILVGDNGGGVAAVANNTLTLDGTIGSAATASGGLTIGIPASSANGNTVGLVPGTGAGTANATAVMATGVVNITGSNFYYGGTTLVSGTTRINGINALGAADYGGLTLSGGNLQYAAGFSGNGSGDLTSIGTAGVTLSGAGGTIDVNGNAVTYAGSIGNNGTGSLTVASSIAGGSLTLNGNNTFTGAVTVNSGSLNLGGANIYTGATTINAATLTLNSGASLANTAITVNSASTLNLHGNTIGSTGATLNLQGSSTLSLEDAIIDIVTLNSTVANGSGAALSVGGSTSAASLLFDINNTASDELVINDGLTTFNTNGGKIFLNDLNNLTPAGSYTLISDPSGGIAVGSGPGADFQLGTSVLTIGGNTYTLSLANSTSTALIVTLASASVNFYWTGNSNSSWATLANFATDAGGLSPQTNNLTANNNVFETANSASNLTQTLDGSYTINSLSFTGTGSTAGSSGINIAGGTGALTLAAANSFADASGSNYAAGVGLVVQPGSAAHTIGANLNLGANQTWLINNSSSNGLIVSGVIADAAGTSLDSLTKSGSGVLIMEGANTYDGGTTINGGTLMLGPGGSLLASAPITVTSTGTFDLGANNQTVRQLLDGGNSTGVVTASTGAATLTIANPVLQSFSGLITDANATNSAASLALQINNTAAITFSGSNSYSGGTTMIAGNLTVANNYALGNDLSQLTTAGLNFASSAGSPAAVVSFTSSSPHIAGLNDTISGVTATGTDSVVLGNGASGGSPTTLFVGGGGGITTFSGVISDLSTTSTGAVGNLAIYGGGELQLGGANTFTGTTTISGTNAFGDASQIHLNNSLALQDSTVIDNDPGTNANPALVFGGLSAATFAGLSGSGNLSVTVALTIGTRNLNSTFTGFLTNIGGGSLIKTGGGTFQVGSGTAGGANLANGIAINQGTVILGGSGTVTGPIAVTGASGASSLIVQDNATIISANPLTFNIGSNDSAFGGTLTLNGTANVAVAGITFGNGVDRAASGDIININSGTLMDSGSLNFINTINGTSALATVVVNLNGGTFGVNNFVLTNAGGATATAATLNLNGGTLLALANDPTGSTFLPAITKLTANVGLGGAIINTNGFTDTITQALVSGTAGDGGLTKSGSGTLILAGSNTYLGATRINAGVLNAANANAIPASSTITFGGGVLQYSAANTADYSGRIANSASAVSIGLNGQAVTFASPLAGSNTGGLNVVDSTPNVGGLTLSASNNYSGATTIGSGARLTLASGGSLPNSNITVNGTLIADSGNGGIGSGSAALNLGSNSLLSLEDGTINSLAINGSLAVGGTTSAAIDFDINTDLLANDSISINGGPVTFGSAGGTITINDLSASTAPANNTQFTLLTDNSGGLGLNAFKLTQTSILINGQNYTLNLLNSTSTKEILTLNTASLNYYWTGQAGSTWTQPNSFAVDPVDSSLQTTALGAAANVFLTANSATNLNMTVDGNYTINSLTFTGTGTTNGATPVTVSSGSSTGLTIAANSPFADTSNPSKTYQSGVGLVSETGASADIISTNIALLNNQTWEIDSANPLTINGIISDGSTLDSLTKTGGGTIVLNNTETYDGGTIIQSGTLQLGAIGALSTAGTLTVTGTGTLDLNGHSQLLNNLSDGGSTGGQITTTSGTSTVFLNNSAVGSYAGKFNDTANTAGGVLNLVVESATNFTLSGSSNFSGGTTVNGPNLTVGGNYALGNPSSSSPAAGLLINPTITGASTVFFTSSNPNIASLNNNAASGAAFVVLGGTATGGAATTLSVGGISTFTGNISDQSATVAAAIGNLNVTGGTVTLGGTDTFTGLTSVSSGTLILGSTTALQNSALNYNNQGGTLSFGGLNSATIGGLTGAQNLALINTAASPVGLTFNVSGTLPQTYSGSLTGSGAITMLKGSQVLTNANYTGATTVTSGTLTIAGGNAGSSTSNLLEDATTLGLIVSGGTFSAGTADIGQIGGQTGASISVTGSGSVNFGTTLLGSAANTGGAITINTSGTASLGNLTVTRDQDGTAKGLIINNGTVTATSAIFQGFGSGNANLNITGGNFVIGSSTSAGAFVIGTGNTSILTMTGGSLTYLGTDGLLLSTGTNITTNTLITGGTATLTGITLNAGNGSTDTSTLVVNNNATLYLGSVGLATNPGTNVTGTFGNSTIGAIASWSSSLPVTLSGTTGPPTATFQAGDSSGNAFNIGMSGALSGSGAIAITGAGKVTFSGSDTYTGSTTVNSGRLIVAGAAGTGILSSTAATIAAAGTLEVDSTFNSAATIVVNGRLSGSGNVGTVNVLTTGTLAPGFSSATPAAAGTMTANGSVTLAAGSSFNIRLGVAVQTDADSLTVAGANTINLNDATLRITDGAVFVGGSGPANMLYVLINGGAGATGTGSDVFGNAPTSGSIVTDTQGDSYAVYYGVSPTNALLPGNDVDLVLVGAVPEPGTWAELIAGILILGVWRRNRRKRSA